MRVALDNHLPCLSLSPAAASASTAVLPGPSASPLPGAVPKKLSAGRHAIQTAAAFKGSKGLSAVTASNSGTSGGI